MNQKSKKEKAPGLLAICPSGLDVPAPSVHAPPHIIPPSHNSHPYSHHPWFPSLYTQRQPHTHTQTLFANAYTTAWWWMMARASERRKREREEYNKELPLAWMLKRAWSRKKKNQPVIPYFVWAANRNLSPTMISPRSAMEWKTRKRGSERQQEREGRMRERERERGWWWRVRTAEAGRQREQLECDRERRRKAAATAKPQGRWHSLGGFEVKKRGERQREGSGGGREDWFTLWFKPWDNAEITLIYKQQL